MATTDRQQMEVDIVCVGFGPAQAGFLTAINKAMSGSDGQPPLESKVMPGMPLQVLCYERGDQVGFGVSGVVTRGRSLRKVFSEAELKSIPMAQEVKEERVLYLLDPGKASRRPFLLKTADFFIRTFGKILPWYDRHAFKLPYIPPFMSKEPGFIFSIGQLCQWAGSNLMASGNVQIWPGMPVKEALIEKDAVMGVRLADQGVDKTGKPEAGFMPGMDVKAALTVVGDGPVGAVGMQLDDRFGFPEGHHVRDWAVGMKMVVQLREDCPLKPGTVIHTFGYPEPEIFGFLYVYADKTASLGIFVPSWFDNPVRTSYRYLQHWMQHPYLWQYLEGAVMRSWGAKSLQESGKHGEPVLAGNGYARIGEGSGSTNVLTGSGVDEAWATGEQLAEAVIELSRAGKPFTKENLEAAYVKRRRASWVEKEGLVAEKSRDGFQKGFIPGFIGMALSGMTNGVLNLAFPVKRPYERIPSIEKYFAGRICPKEIAKIREECSRTQTPLYEKLMEKCGWPKIQYDGKLLVSHQDALILGGKVQAAAGFADHVRFLEPAICRECREKVCIEICSAQAIMPGEDGGVPQFDREKCIHCGACMWNCSRPRKNNPERSNLSFEAGSGGLHSAEN